MSSSNRTKMTQFILLGLECPHALNTLLFVLFLVIYIVMAVVNIMIIVLVAGSHHLHSPMYFFLSHLSLCDIFLSTNVVPTLLSTLLREVSIMTFTGCIVQYYFEAAFIVSECYLLTMMSYDRYLAICNPLRYISIMGIKLSLHLVLCSWILGFLIPMVSTISLSFLEYCGGNIIDHIYCDFVPLVELSCSDTSFLKVQALVFSAFAVIGPFVFINVTYISIFLTILNISSKIGRKKAFSTCSSHLMVVCTYYGTLTAKYIVPSNGNSLTVSKVISLLYTVVTPLFNPIVYSLRNQEIWKALGKWHSVKI